MEIQSNIAEAMRKMSEAYVGGLATVMKTLESLPRQGGESNRPMVEQWLSLARMSKDSYVAALNQGFELWERECRRIVGAPHPAGSGSAPPGGSAPSASPMEAWAESWKRTVEGFSTGGAPGDPSREAARRQAEMVQQALQESMRAWQGLWQPPERR
jgi:hypothetical protein